MDSLDALAILKANYHTTRDKKLFEIIEKDLIKLKELIEHETEKNDRRDE